MTVRGCLGCWGRIVMRSRVGVNVCRRLSCPYRESDPGSWILINTPIVVFGLNTPIVVFGLDTPKACIREHAESVHSGIRRRRWLIPAQGWSAATTLGFG